MSIEQNQKQKRKKKYRRLNGNTTIQYGDSNV